MQLALFADLPRHAAPPRRPERLSSESIALLQRAVAQLHLAGDARGHLGARYHVGRAADFLRQAGAADLARVAYDALDDAIGHPYTDGLADRVDARITNRMIKQTGVV